MKNINTTKENLKKKTLTLAFVAAMVGQTFANNNSNPTTTLETGKTLEWKMPEGKHNDDFYADNNHSEDKDSQLNELGDGGKVNSKAMRESIKFVGKMVTDYNGVIYGQTLPDSLIQSIDTIGLQMLINNLKTDIAEFERINKELSEKSAKVNNNKLIINMPDIPLIFKKGELEIGKDEKNNSKATAIQSSRTEYKTGYENTYQEICKKIISLRFSDEKSKTDATNQAIEIAGSKLLEKLKKVGKTILDYQKSEYESGPKTVKKN